MYFWRHKEENETKAGPVGFDHKWVPELKKIVN
jgi:hypothetical protein